VPFVFHATDFSTLNVWPFICRMLIVVVVGVVVAFVTVKVRSCCQTVLSSVENWYSYGRKGTWHLM
jgi:hypothetical protein